MRIAQFAETIRQVESIAFGSASVEKPYVQTSDGQRYVKAAGLRHHPSPAVSSHKGNPDLCWRSRGLGDRLQQAKRRLFNRVYLPCTADIVLLRKNLSLFYFNSGIRIKVETTPPNIPVQTLTREYDIRRNVERMGCLKIPPIVEGHLDGAPLFFMDQIIEGDVFSWRDSGAQDTFRRLIPNVWEYYQLTGIHWKTPQENGHDTRRLIGEYEHALKAHPEIMFPFDLKRIEDFHKQQMPCTRIHGDLVIHNIIVSDAGDFLLDWEMSVFDYLIRDFHRLLIIPDWTLDDVISPLMKLEIDSQRSKRGGTFLSFSDQLYFILFLEIHRMLTTTHYPVRLLRKAQIQMETFFSSFNTLNGVRDGEKSRE